MSRKSQLITRREALRRTALLAAGLSASSLLKAADAPTVSVKPKIIRPPARSVIQIWLWGGPAHLDTFDPKPDAGADYCGPFTSPIETNVSGIRINELLPELAKQADKYSLIRGMTHGINGHETAAYLTQTGHEPDRFVYPAIGAVVNYFKGYGHGYQGLVPPYVVLTQPQGRFSESGFLGPRYKPFATGGDPNQSVFTVEGIVAKGISDERQQARREFLANSNTFGGEMARAPEFKRFESAQNQAWDMILGECRSIFDLNMEPAELRERYGRNRFGQSCLMARRLVEHGVPYITINYQGWDTHKDHFPAMRRKLPELDRGLAALLRDLHDRGLLDSTIVWAGGEFGRTPKVLWDAPWNGGRGHFGACFSTLVAGGGFAGGQVLGASDPRGMEVAERPVYPAEFLRSIHTLMGIDPDGDLPNPHGVEMKIMPVRAVDGKTGNDLMREIMPTMA